MWSFETDPEFQASLDWIDEFTREEIEPLDLVFREPGDPWDPKSPAFAAMAPLREIVKAKQLWACHLEPELGGQGYGQVSLGLMNEILGRSRLDPASLAVRLRIQGNAEILAKFGTPEQKEKYLKPLLNAEIASCYSMTEPQAGADPANFSAPQPEMETSGSSMVRSGLPPMPVSRRFLLVMVVTDPDAPIHEGASIFLVEQGTPGMEIIRNSAVGPYVEQGDGVHAYISFKDCRVPAEKPSWQRGQGFHVAQTRSRGWSCAPCHANRRRHPQSA